MYISEDVLFLYRIGGLLENLLNKSLTTLTQFKSPTKMLNIGFTDIFFITVLRLTYSRRNHAFHAS